MALKQYYAVNVGTLKVAVITSTGTKTIIGCLISNKSVSSANVTVTITKANNDIITLIPVTTFDASDVLDPLQGSKIVIENGDIIKVVSTVANSVDVLISVYE